MLFDFVAHLSFTRQQRNDVETHEHEWRKEKVIIYHQHLTSSLGPSKRFCIPPLIMISSVRCPSGLRTFCDQICIFKLTNDLAGQRVLGLCGIDFKEFCNFTIYFVNEICAKYIFNFQKFQNIDFFLAKKVKKDISSTNNVYPQQFFRNENYFHDYYVVIFNATGYYYISISYHWTVKQFAPSNIRMLIL